MRFQVTLAALILAVVFMGIIVEGFAKKKKSWWNKLMARRRAQRNKRNNRKPVATPVQRTVSAPAQRSITSAAAAGVAKPTETECRDLIFNEYKNTQSKKYYCGELKNKPHKSLQDRNCQKYKDKLKKTTDCKTDNKGMEGDVARQARERKENQYRSTPTEVKATLKDANKCNRAKNQYNSMKKIYKRNPKFYLPRMQGSYSSMQSHCTGSDMKGFENPMCIEKRLNNLPAPWQCRPECKQWSMDVQDGKDTQLPPTCSDKHSLSSAAPQNGGGTRVPSTEAEKQRCFMMKQSRSSDKKSFKKHESWAKANKIDCLDPKNNDYFKSQYTTQINRIDARLDRMENDPNLGKATKASCDQLLRKLKISPSQVDRQIQEGKRIENDRNADPSKKKDIARDTKALEKCRSARVF
nr:hypothetical protein TetV2_00077 [Oceanusvirus sp.]